MIAFAFGWILGACSVWLAMAAPYRRERPYRHRELDSTSVVSVLPRRDP